jgi:hypothetical protein
MIAVLLATHVLAAAPPAASIAPGTYVYKASLAGTSVGTSTITVKQNGTVTEIDERASGSYQGESGSGSALLLLGSDLAPTHYQATGSFAGSPTKDSATIDGTSASVTTPRGQTSSIGLLASTKHFVVIDLGTMAGFIPLPAQMKAWDDSPALAVVPTFGQSVALIPDDGPAPARPAGVPPADVAISFSGQTPFTIWYNPITFVPDEIDITSQGLVVVRATP